MGCEYERFGFHAIPYGKNVHLTAADFRNFVAHRVINATEAAELLGCSRQNIIDLIKREIDAILCGNRKSIIPATVIVLENARDIRMYSYKK